MTKDEREHKLTLWLSKAEAFIDEGGEPSRRLILFINSARRELGR